MAVPFRNEWKDSLFDDLPEPERREAEADGCGSPRPIRPQGLPRRQHGRQLPGEPLLPRVAGTRPARGGRLPPCDGGGGGHHRLRGGCPSAAPRLRPAAPPRAGGRDLPAPGLRGAALRLRQHAISLRVPRGSPGMGTPPRAIRPGAPPLEGLGERQARRGPGDRQPARGSTARKASSSRPTGSPSSPPSVMTRRSSATTSPVTSWWRAGRRERAAADGQNQAGEQVAA